ncbi:MAG: 50S ribosomal protein L10 [Candidatus Niyogibacteria bacterium]|nr:50S ribosomal protein L10 [Candidatus Niyogibacteria bacterium]
MTITRAKKEEIIKDIHSKLEKSQISIFVNFHGLSVKDVSELRNNLRKDTIDYKVAKKTLINRALDGFGFSGEKPPLEGELALVLGYDDAVAPARNLFSFVKKHKESVKILGGVFEKAYINESMVSALAVIPPRDTLLGQFVNVINSPVQGMVGALSGVMRNFVSVLGQIKKEIKK